MRSGAFVGNLPLSNGLSTSFAGKTFKALEEKVLLPGHVCPLPAGIHSPTRRIFQHISLCAPTANILASLKEQFWRGKERAEKEERGNRHKGTLEALPAFTYETRRDVLCLIRLSLAARKGGRK